MMAIKDLKTQDPHDAHETSKTFKTVAKTIYFEPTHAKDASNFSRRGCEGRVEGIDDRF